MTQPLVIHQLLIRHPSRTALLVEGQASDPRLPSVALQDRHTAEVDYINGAVLQRCGLATTVLRSLRHDLDAHSGGVIRTHELEVHGNDVAPPPGSQWCGTEILASLPPDDAGIAAEWFAGAGAPRQAVAGREWALPGWFAEARGWIEQRLCDSGAGPVRDIVQLRAWASSCVLRARAARGEFFFKALPAGGHEWALTQYLAQHFGDAVPRLLATHAERRWLLMHGAGDHNLEDFADVQAWQRAAAMYARLQAACVPRTGELRALGCPERSLAGLAAAIEPLAADTPALRVGEADGLSVESVERLRALVPELRRRCSALAAQAVPLTLEHGDLWPGNFLLSATTCVVIDWEDAAVGHPFFSLAPLLVGLATYQPALNTADVRRALQDAYLAAFADVGRREDLRAALALAAPLSFIDMAIRYRSQRPSMVRLHPWMRDLVPHAVKLALAAS